MDIWNALSNREKALIVWLVIVFFILILRSDTRKSLGSVVKALFRWKLLVALIGLVVYVCVELLIFSYINLWNATFLKDVVFWLLGTGLVLFLNVNKATENENYFKAIVRDSLKLAIVLEFVINFYTFSLPIEFVMLPVLFIISAVGVISGAKEETKVVKKATDFLLGAYGIVLLLFTVSSLTNNFQLLATSDNLHAFVLPPALTLAFIPFLYFVGLIMAYEDLFVHIRVLTTREEQLMNFIRLSVFKLCKFDLQKLIRLKKSKYQQLVKVRSESELLDLVRDFRESEALRSAK